MSILREICLETQLEVVAPDDEARPKRLPVRFPRMLILLRVTSTISLTLLRRQELYSGVGRMDPPWALGGRCTGTGGSCSTQHTPSQEELRVQEVEGIVGNQKWCNGAQNCWKTQVGFGNRKDALWVRFQKRPRSTGWKW